MSDSSPGAAARPLSPHLQVWRWHITMACSILTRATGIALYLGALILMAWAICLASGPGPYGMFMATLGSVLGKIVLFGLTVSIFYHLAAGVRHLFWDAGKGFQPRTAELTGATALAFGVVAAIAVFVVAAVTGAM